MSVFESIKQGLEEAIEITMTKERLDLYKTIWAMPEPYAKDCTNCQCTECVYDCDQCVHKHDDIVDCRELKIWSCPYFTTPEQMDKLLDDEK